MWEVDVLVPEAGSTVRGQAGRWVIATLVATLPLWFVIGSYPLWRDRLPDPMPSHWGASGEVDGTTSLAGTVTTMGVMTGVGVLVAWFGALAHRLKWSTRRILLGIGAAVSGFGAGLWWVTASLALDVADPYQAPEPTWQILALLAAMAVVPAVAVVALGRAPGRRAATGQPDPDLPRAAVVEGEQPVWREAFLPSRAFLLLPALLLGLAAVMAVAVDQRGLHVGLGPWGWPRITVPLAEIASAEVTEVRPFEWGGWGYRMRPGGRALVIRGGPGVRLVLSEDREFLTNTRDPQAVAGLINTLIERAGR